jgi:F-type H+-transporting ATPase subunit c
MKLVKLLGLVVAVFLLSASAVFAQDRTGNSYAFSGAGIGAGLGMALSIIGAGYGLGRIGSAALESMARQPEVAPRVQTAMIIVAAMLEGATLASVILCFLVGNRATF